MNTPKLMTTALPISTPGIRNVSIVIAASVLVGLSAHIILPLPFTPVPISMAPFAVLLIGLVLSPRMAATALLAYLAEGAAGLPFFAPNGPGGLAHLVWPTAGYLFAFPLAAYVTAKVYRSLSRTFFAAILATTAGSVALFAIGATWLGFALHLGVQSTIAAGVMPFLIGDALKILAASGAATAWKRIRN
jgi:biotin transport system substrate-specific component